MNKRLFQMTMGLSIMVLAAQQVPAQTPNCAPRADVLARLAAQFGETRSGIGMTRQGTVMEVFASDDTGTWTITVTQASGLTCLVAAGEAYEALTEALPPNT